MKLTFNSVDEIVAKKLDNCFPVSNCFIEVHPGRVLIPRKYVDVAETILDLPVYSDDIWLVSYPRTGSTWAQEMIWLLANNLNFEGAKELQQFRTPLLELTAIYSADHYEWVSNAIGNTVDCVRNMVRPRFVKSHLPLPLLPKEIDEVKPKIIYTARNPKDLCVSYYHYCKLVHGIKGSFAEFCELFLNENTPFGSYWSHVLPFWQKRDDDNILFLKYEEMNRDLPSVIKKCAKFLNVNYDLTETNMKKVLEHLKFDKMQSNPAVNLDAFLNNPSNVIKQTEQTDDVKFIRKGQIGDWMNYLTEEVSVKFDKWIEKNTNDTGLSFEYE